MNIKFETIEEMLYKQQILKGRKKLIFHQDTNNYYDEMEYLKQSIAFLF